MEDYTHQWRVYRRLWMGSLLLLLGFVPASHIAFVISERALHSEKLGLAITIVWLLAWVFTWVSVCAWRCPRCRRRYIGRWWYGNVWFFRKCAYCGLPKKANR